MRDTVHTDSRSARDKSVYIQTFGCQMNEHDTAKMLEILRQQRYRAVDSPERADLILLNTCAIRDKPEHKVYSLLGRLERLKRRRPGVMVGVGGCVAQQDGERVLRRSPIVDLVFGPDNLYDLPEMVGEAARGRRVVRTEWHHRRQRVANFVPPAAMGVPDEAFRKLDDPEQGDILPENAGPVGPKAHLAITKGCNNFCSFCVVPYTRGREVSREPDNIVREAVSLSLRGARELMLLGQNVNSYRAGGVRFVDLLHRLHEVPGLERIRYTSPHPKDFTGRLAQAHAELPKLCEHLHLPFQSGSNRILKAMRRHHTIESYLDKMAMVKERVPGIAVSTDIIVGFPGETEADFEATLEVMRRVRFDHVYAFKFSPRTITPAARLPHQVDEAVRAERLNRLLELHTGIQQELNERLIGTRQEILVEGPHPRDAHAVVGRTRGHKSTAVLDCDAAPGTLVTVDIVAVRKFSLVGRVSGHGGSQRVHRNESLPLGA